MSPATRGTRERLLAHLQGIDIRALLPLAAGFVAAFHAVTIVQAELRAHYFGPDWSVFWTAARHVFVAPDVLYDPMTLTRAQDWLIPAEIGLRPWAYPPTTLLVLLPLAWLPFWVSYAGWIASTVTALAIAARRQLHMGPGGLALLLLAPPAVQAALQGQTTLLVAPVLLLGIALLDRRPGLAGALLGVAFLVKPQALVLLPLALLAGRHLRAIYAGTATGIGMVAVTLLLFDPQLWLNWTASIPEFLTIVADKGLLASGVAPKGLAAALGLAGPTGALVHGALTAIGVLFLTTVFATRRDYVSRSCALVGGSVLCSSYTLGYDLLLLAPAAVAVLLADPSRHGLAARLTAIGAGCYWLGPVAPVAFTTAICAPAVRDALHGLLGRRTRGRVAAVSWYEYLSGGSDAPPPERSRVLLGDQRRSRSATTVVE